MSIYLSKYLIIGSLLTTNPRSYGGTTIAMDKMIKYFKEENIEHVAIQTNRYYFKLSFMLNYLIALYRFYRNISINDIVIINATANAAFIVAPLFYLISRQHKCKFVFRKYAGSFSSIYEKKCKIFKSIFNRTILKSDALFFETKSIVNYFIEIGVSNVHWLPNTRETVIDTLVESSYRKRFVFISSVKRTKGIDEIVDAIHALSEDYIFDIYGTITDNKYSEAYFNNKNINYFGSLKPSKLIETISKYDVIVLPTFHSGEGYPGIIIDGYSLGKPCITTNWQSIPEIVDHTKTGLLIDIKSHQKLISMP